MTEPAESGPHEDEDLVDSSISITLESKVGATIDCGYRIPAPPATAVLHTLEETMNGVKSWSKNSSLELRSSDPGVSRIRLADDVGVPEDCEMGVAIENDLVIEEPSSEPLVGVLVFEWQRNESGRGLMHNI